MTIDTRDISDRLARVEQKIDIVVDIHTKAIDDHETRIRDLENGKARLLGIGATLALAVSIFSSKIAQLF